MHRCGQLYLKRPAHRPACNFRTLQAMQQQRTQLWEAQQAAAALDSQLAQQHAAYGIERSKAEGALAAARDELALARRALAASQREREAAVAGWQQEVEARLAAEQSERRALQQAAEQVGGGGPVLSLR